MIGQLDIIVLDTANVKGLSAFYEKAAGFTIVDMDDDWVNMSSPDGWRVALQQANDHVPPRWPDPAYPQQMHLDLLVADLDAAVERAVAAGATRLPGGGDTYRVLADPSGHPFCLCRRDGVDGVRLSDVCIDCPDAAPLARFYASLLGMEITYEGAEGAMISVAGQPSVVFQNVARFNPPRWPDPAYPQQFHLDVAIDTTPDTVDEIEVRTLALGATRLPGDGERFRAFADPVGHPFCLVW